MVALPIFAAANGDIAVAQETTVELVANQDLAMQEENHRLTTHHLHRHLLIILLLLHLQIMEEEARSLLGTVLFPIHLRDPVSPDLAVPFQML